MPLREGSSRAAIEANIAELVRVGYEPRQAAAIAYRKARERRDDVSPEAARTLRQIHVHRAVGLAKPRRRLPRQVPPKLIANDYRRALGPIVARWSSALARVKAELPSILAQARRERGDGGRERLDADSVGRVRMLVETSRREASVRAQEIEILADHYGQRTVAFQRAQLGRQIRAALGVDVHMSDANVAAIIRHHVHANVALITSIPNRLLDDVENAVIRGVVSGQTAEQIGAEIDRLAGIGARRALNIARDQIQKLFEDVNRSRQKEIGVTRFRWRTQRDNRVRSHHRVLEGVTFEYAHLPRFEGKEIFPGSEHQCRCQAEPVFADLLGEL